MSDYLQFMASGTGPLSRLPRGFLFLRPENPCPAKKNPATGPRPGRGIRRDQKPMTLKGFGSSVLRKQREPFLPLLAGVAEVLRHHHDVGKIHGAIPEEVGAVVIDAVVDLGEQGQVGQVDDQVGGR